MVLLREINRTEVVNVTRGGLWEVEALGWEGGGVGACGDHGPFYQIKGGENRLRKGLRFPKTRGGGCTTSVREGDGDDAGADWPADRGSHPISSYGNAFLGGEGAQKMWGGTPWVRKRGQSRGRFRTGAVLQFSRGGTAGQSREGGDRNLARAERLVESGSRVMAARKARGPGKKASDRPARNKRIAGPTRRTRFSPHSSSVGGSRAPTITRN